MPPKKKARSGARTAATPTPSVASSMIGDDETREVHPSSPPPKPRSPSKPGELAYDPLNDLWTDEQETSLFKGLIRWKPAGMHKHFRMIALSEHLRNHGYNEEHTRTPGIWKKLGTLYDLERIDASENRLDFGIEMDDEDEGGTPLEGEGEAWREFELPEEFDEMCFMRGKRRDDSETRSSPPRIDDGNAEVDEEEEELPPPNTIRKRKRGQVGQGGQAQDTLGTRQSTVEDTDEAATSPAPPSSLRGSISVRARGRGRGRGRVPGLQRSSVDRGASRETDTAQETTEVDTATGEDEDETEEEDSDEDTAAGGSPRPRVNKRQKGGARGANLRGRGKRGKKRGGRGG